GGHLRPGDVRRPQRRRPVVPHAPGVRHAYLHGGLRLLRDGPSGRGRCRLGAFPVSEKRRGN
ncbi:unnamed protein product, partial [Heterosigma akashiwo]